MKTWLLLAVFLPLIGVGLVYLISKYSTQAGSWVTAITCGLTFMATCFMYPTVSQGKVIEQSFDVGFPILISFRVDALGLILAMISSFLWFMASLYAVEYMRVKQSKIRFNIFSLFSFLGMMGIVLAGNLLTLYIFFEIMAILSYMLVIHEETQSAMKAGIKYLFMGIAAGLVLLIAIIATYVITQSTDLSGRGLAGLTSSSLFGIIFWCYILGFAVKAGLFPVHVWLPDAHPVAPSPASALLSGVMIKAGVYGIIRTIYAIYGSGQIEKHLMTSNTVLIGLAIASILIGSLVAITQKELKRMLAYSSVAQVGYIVLGACLLSPRGLQGGIIHIFNHAFMKGTLFLATGAFIYKRGVRTVDDLKGIGRRMPVTMTCFTLAALSMIGFPPLCGFISKWYLGLGAVQSYNMGVYGLAGTIVFISSLLISALLNAIYYGPIMIRGWFGNHDSHQEEVKREDPAWPMLVPLILLGLGTLVFGIFVNLPLGLAEVVSKFYFPH